MSELDELIDLLEFADAKIDFDPGRNHSHACAMCGKRPAERGEGAFGLVRIGTYLNGAALTRPVCETCKQRSSARWGGAGRPCPGGSRHP